MCAMMKEMYQQPKTMCIHIDTCHQILEGSYVSIGGKGSFDVKEESDWTDIWDDKAETSSLP